MSHDLPWSARKTEDEPRLYPPDHLPSPLADLTVSFSTGSDSPSLVFPSQPFKTCHFTVLHPDPLGCPQPQGLESSPHTAIQCNISPGQGHKLFPSVEIPRLPFRHCCTSAKQAAKFMSTWDSCSKGRDRREKGALCDIKSYPTMASLAGNVPCFQSDRL